MSHSGAPFEPRQVLLFSGHRVDAPGRATPRFPATMVPQAAAAIGHALDALGAGPGDLALAQGAAGGDLLFAQACAERGVRVELLLPLPRAQFIAQSVLGSDGAQDWHARFLAVEVALQNAPRVMCDELGPLPAGADAFKRGNLWLLDSALAHGAHKLRFICLWDGVAGDAGGGTAHMVGEVRRYHLPVTWIDTRRLGVDARPGAP